ncbi:MAG: NAD(P)H-hydrate epimerase [Chloroflexi bacterium]|jgi:NAD(P)H-hydrate epimerase|nr:MAG: NAD(P)H-hydrate epimerase [Chloroflexota bacterium]
MKIVTSKQMSDLENMSEASGVSKEQLMENAGREIAYKAITILSEPKKSPVLILVGSGNNGGDGLVAASHLKSTGTNVTVYVCLGRKIPDQKMDSLKKLDISVIYASSDPNLAALKKVIRNSHLVIDAILGTGRSRPIKGQLQEILAEISKARNDNRIQVLAVDLPTGVDSDSGQVDPSCAGADQTVALSNPKLGHFTMPGLVATGELSTVDIGVPKGLANDITLELITPELVASLLPKRAKHAHKGTFGRLLVVAGSMSYVGASILACSAAYRSGVGLVTLATSENVYPIVASKLSEVTFIPLSSTNTGEIDDEDVDKVIEKLPEYDAMVIGCGLGQHNKTGEFLSRLLLQNQNLPDLPIVIDADALNFLAKFDGWHKHLNSHTILTPHPREMARLLGTSVDEVQKDRLGIAKESAGYWEKVVLLKGALSIVTPDKEHARINPFANPLLASAGTGDVLTGLIGGLLAQGLSSLDAATCGAYLHGLSGEQIGLRIGDSGLLASDLLNEIPLQIKSIKESYEIK